jgi:uncharacterized protein YodC (DUF2158 family)
MEIEYKAGDVVHLKSGGPKMTVTEVRMWNGKMRVWCEWFSGDKNSSDSFPPESLKPVEQTGSGPVVAVSRPKTTWS